MAVATTKRRRGDEEASRPKKKFKKVKKQKTYHSSSEDEDDAASEIQRKASDVPRPKQAMERKVPIREFQKTEKTNPRSILKQTVPLPEATDSMSEDDNEDEEQDGMDVDINVVDELERNTALNAMPEDESDGEPEDDELDLDAASNSEDEDMASGSDTSERSSQAARSRKKRNDPDAFATSISKILATKLTSSKRQDPLLSRSRSAAEANKSLADSKLEQKAKAQIRAEKKQALEKGRIKDVLGLQTPDVDTGAIVEEEKKLKKTAQRGVVKLFNAVRAAQVKAEEAMRQARSEGMVGMQRRDEKVTEMSKQGFLDLISSGGNSTAAVVS